MFKCKAAEILFLALLAVATGCAPDVLVQGPAAAAVVAAAAAAVLANDVTQPSKFKVEFVASAPPDKGPSVEMTGDWLASTERLQVTVWLNNFKNLVGIAGHLRYDASALELVDLQAQGVPHGSDPAKWQARAVAKISPEGRVLAGGAIFSVKPSPFAALAGAKVSRESWLIMEFVVKKQASTVIAFDPDTLVARDDQYTDLAVVWGNGTIKNSAGAGGK